ncbi:hypothetical protein N5I10_04120, partial [Comamonas aquatica]
LGASTFTSAFFSLGCTATALGVAFDVTTLSFFGKTAVATPIANMISSHLPTPPFAFFLAGVVDPQCGQVFASELTDFPHSLHVVIAIFFVPFYFCSIYTEFRSVSRLILA